MRGGLQIGNLAAKVGYLTRFCRRWAKIPLGKCAMTEFFFRIRAESGKLAESGCPVSARRKRPGVALGARSQKPVGIGGNPFGYAQDRLGRYIRENRSCQKRNLRQTLYTFRGVNKLANRTNHPFGYAQDRFVWR